MKRILPAVSPMLLMFVVVAALGQSSTPPDGKEVEVWLAKTVRISLGEQPASANSAAYPFCVPAIRHLEKLELRSRICFFAGENGSGKSTLLEAIARALRIWARGRGLWAHRQTS